MFTLNGTWNYAPNPIMYGILTVMTMCVELGVILTIFGMLERRNYSEGSKYGFLFVAVVVSNVLTALGGWLILNAV